MQLLLSNAEDLITFSSKFFVIIVSKLTTLFKFQSHSFFDNFARIFPLRLGFFIICVSIKV